MEVKMHATTIVGVKRDGKVAIAGAGQVTLDKSVMKKHREKDPPIVQRKDPDRLRRQRRRRPSARGPF